MLYLVALMALTRGLPRAEADIAALCAGGQDDSSTLLSIGVGTGVASANGPGAGTGTVPSSTTRANVTPSSKSSPAAPPPPPALTLQQVHVHAAGCVGSLVPGARPQLACALFDPVLFDTDALTQVLLVQCKSLQ